MSVSSRELFVIVTAHKATAFPVQPPDDKPHSRRLPLGIGKRWRVALLHVKILLDNIVLSALALSPFSRRVSFSCTCQRHRY